MLEIANRIDAEALDLTASRPFEGRIRDHGQQLIDLVRLDGEADLIAALAVPLPMIAIFELVGITNADRAQVGLMLGHRAMEDPAAMSDYADFCRAELDARRAAPRDDLLTRLATESADAVEQLTDVLEEGMHASVSGIARVLQHVAERPRLRDRLVIDRAAVAELVDALLPDENTLHAAALALARLQMRVALDLALDSLPGFRLAGDPGERLPLAWDA